MINEEQAACDELDHCLEAMHLLHLDSRTKVAVSHPHCEIFKYLRLEF